MKSRASLKNYSNGVYDGEMKNGKKSGRGCYSYRSGARYQGEWKNGKKEGTGYFKYSNGDEYSGEWKNNGKNGNGTYYHHKSGTKYEGEWKDDTKHGKGVEYTRNGIKIKGEWVHGKKVADKVDLCSDGGISYLQSENENLSDRLRESMNRNQEKTKRVFQISQEKMKIEGENLDLRKKLHKKNEVMEQQQKIHLFQMDKISEMIEQTEKKHRLEMETRNVESAKEIGSLKEEVKLGKCKNVECHQKIQFLEKKISLELEFEYREMINHTNGKEQLENIRKDMKEVFKNVKEKYKMAMKCVEKRERVLEFSEMDTEQKLCKICFERKWETCLYPCGHVLCTSCSTKVRDRCPFCRNMIRRRAKLYL